MPRMRMIEKRIRQAMTNLMPAKVNGGRSSRPSFINNQVEPQIPHRINQTSRAFIPQNIPATKKHKQHNVDRKSLRYLCFLRLPCQTVTGPAAVLEVRTRRPVDPSESQNVRHRECPRPAS